MPIAPALPAIGAGILGFIGQNEAADAQTDASRDAMNLQRRMYEEGVARQMPFLQGGYRAHDEVMALMGLGPSGGVGGYNAYPYGVSRQSYPRQKYGQSYPNYNPGLNYQNTYDAPTQYRGAPGVYNSNPHQYASWNNGGIPGGVAGYPRRNFAPEPQYNVPTQPYGSPGYQQIGYQNPQDIAMQGFFNSPTYKLAYDQGLNAIEGSAAARGDLFSGRTLRAISDYGQDRATQLFDNYYDKLHRLAGMGPSTVSSINSAGQTYAGNASAQINAMGQARANRDSQIFGGLASGLGSIGFG